MRTLLIVCLWMFPSLAASQTPKAVAQEAHTEAKKQNVSNGDNSQSKADTKSNPSGTNQTTGPKKNEKQILKSAFAPETWSNWALFIAAGIATAIALRTLNAIKEQARIARIGLNATRVAANAARDGARAAAESNTLTQQSNATAAKATELTRQSVILTHRPKLIVRNIILDNENSILNFGSGHGWPVEGTGTARIVNVGSSTAHLIAWSCHVLILFLLPITPPFDVKEEELFNLPIAPGEYAAVHFPTTRAEPLAAEDLLRIRGAAGLYVLGRAVYKDDLGTVRTTSFCREWRKGYERFKPVDNPDYENAD